MKAFCVCNKTRKRSWRFVFVLLPHFVLARVSREDQKTNEENNHLVLRLHTVGLAGLLLLLEV